MNGRFFLYWPEEAVGELDDRHASIANEALEQFEQYQVDGAQRSGTRS